MATSTVDQTTSTEADTAASSGRDPQTVSSFNEEELLDKYSDLIESGERLSEGLEVMALINAMPTRIEVDSEWFFMPKAWLDKWEAYCYVDIINAAKDGTIEESVEDLKKVERSNPGRIKFSGLFEEKDKAQIEEQAIKFKWQNH